MGVQEATLAERISHLFASTNDWAKIAKELEALLTGLHAPVLLRVSIASATDVGRRREHNEDSYLTMHFERCHLDQTEALAILAVADGMGGHAAGEVASKLCLQTFATSLLDAIQQWLQFHEPDWATAEVTCCKEGSCGRSRKTTPMSNNWWTQGY
jgi:protein phosphatase